MAQVGRGQGNLGRPSNAKATQKKADGSPVATGKDAPRPGAHVTGRDLKPAAGGGVVRKDDELKRLKARVLELEERALEAEEEAERFARELAEYEFDRANDRCRRWMDEAAAAGTLEAPDGGAGAAYSDAEDDGAEVDHQSEYGELRAPSSVGADEAPLPGTATDAHGAPVPGRSGDHPGGNGASVIGAVDGVRDTGHAKAAPPGKMNANRPPMSATKAAAEVAIQSLRAELEESAKEREALQKRLAGLESEIAAKDAALESAALELEAQIAKSTTEKGNLNTLLATARAEAGEAKREAAVLHKKVESLEQAAVSSAAAAVEKRRAGEQAEEVDVAVLLMERDALARELDKNRRELSTLREDGQAARKQRDLLQAELASTRAAYIEHLDARRQIDELRAHVEQAKQELQVAAGERDAAVLTRQLGEQECEKKVAAAQAQAAEAEASLSASRAELHNVSTTLAETIKRYEDADARCKEALEAKSLALAAQAAAEAHTAAALHDVQMEQEARARVEQESLELKAQAATSAAEFEASLEKVKDALAEANAERDKALQAQAEAALKVEAAVEVGKKLVTAHEQIDKLKADIEMWQGKLATEKQARQQMQDVVDKSRSNIAAFERTKAQLIADCEEGVNEARRLQQANEAEARALRYQLKEEKRLRTVAEQKLTATEQQLSAITNDLHHANIRCERAERKAAKAQMFAQSAEARIAEAEAECNAKVSDALEKMERSRVTHVTNEREAMRRAQNAEKQLQEFKNEVADKFEEAERNKAERAALHADREMALAAERRAVAEAERAKTAAGIAATAASQIDAECARLREEADAAHAGALSLADALADRDARLAIAEKRFNQAREAASAAVAERDQKIKDLEAKLRVLQQAYKAERKRGQSAGPHPGGGGNGDGGGGGGALRPVSGGPIRGVSGAFGEDDAGGPGGDGDGGVALGTMRGGGTGVLPKTARWAPLRGGGTVEVPHAEPPSGGRQKLMVLR